MEFAKANDNPESPPDQLSHAQSTLAGLT